MCGVVLINASLSKKKKRAEINYIIILEMTSEIYLNIKGGKREGATEKDNRTQEEEERDREKEGGIGWR